VDFADPNLELLVNNMGFITSATLSWFDDGCCDVKYLDEWQDAPLSFTTGQATDSNWHKKSYEEIILPEADGRSFQTAADHLLRFHFYPQHILSFTSDFTLEQRRLRRGDRIVQRIHLLRLLGRPILDVMTITEVTNVVDESHRAGFSYVSVFPHVVQGQWQAAVVWDESGALRLTVDSILRPDPVEPASSHVLIRYFQRQAHRQGLSHFRQLIQRAQVQCLPAGRHTPVGDESGGIGPR
jgi:uncharacterized protein (UPF0548 family)